MLDLGCGPRDQAPVFDYLKCKYVGIDYGGTTPDILADAHSIPFQPGTFDVVFSYAVLEHLYNPFLAIMEIDRVLKPGGVYCGTVSQGDPFHASFFHHTTWGFVSLIEQSGMEIRRLWGCYDTLIGLARIGRYPRVIRMVLWVVNTLNAKSRSSRRGRPSTGRSMNGNLTSCTVRPESASWCKNRCTAPTVRPLQTPSRPVDRGSLGNMGVSSDWKRPTSVGPGVSDTPAGRFRPAQAGFGRMSKSGFTPRISD